MALPEQVRKQSEAVAQLYKDLNTDEPPSGDEPPVTDEGTEGVTDEGTGAGTGKAGKADSGAGTATQPKPKEQAGNGPDDEEQTMEQRYRTLQGMYNADTGRLRSENQQLRSRLSQVEQLLSSLSQTPPKAADAPATKYVTDQDVEEYGDSIDLMRRVSREETLSYEREISSLKDTIRNLQANVIPRVEQVAHTQMQSTEQQFWSELGRLVPDWREVNADASFHSWLLEVDPLAGVPRQTFLDNAQRSYDAGRVAQFFNAWKGGAGSRVAQPNTHASDSQLEKQVSPGRGRGGGSAPSGGQPKTYSVQDIEKFYADVRRGQFKGKDEERARIERDIFAAQREGRIANG